MNKQIVSLTAILAGLVISNAAHAEVTTRLRTGVAVLGSYDISAHDSPFANFDLQYEADYFAIPIGVTVMFGNHVYADLAYQSSSGDVAFSFASEKPDFKRSEVTATVGSRFKNFSAYLGYKQGKSRTDWPLGLPPDKFETSGIVAGFGASIPISRNAISFSFGLGYLDGTYTWAPGELIEFDNTLGYSLGVGYSYTFSRNWSIAADYKWNLYSYEQVNTDLAIDEELSQATISVALSF